MKLLNVRMLILVVTTVLSMTANADPNLEREWQELKQNASLLYAAGAGTGNPLLVERLTAIISNPTRLRSVLGHNPAKANEAPEPEVYKKYLITVGIGKVRANDTPDEQRLEYALAVLASFRDNRKDGEGFINYICTQFSQNLYRNISDELRQSIVRSLTQYAHNDKNYRVVAFPALTLVASVDSVLRIVDLLVYNSDGTKRDIDGTDERMLWALVKRHNLDLNGREPVQRYMLDRLKSALPRVSRAALAALVDTKPSFKSEVNQLHPHTVAVMREHIADPAIPQEQRIKMITALTHDMRSNWFMPKNDFAFSDTYAVMITLLDPVQTLPLRKAAIAFFAARKPADVAAQSALVTAAFKDKDANVSTGAFNALGINSGARSSERRISDPVVQQLVLDRMAEISNLNPRNIEKLFRGAVLLDLMPRIADAAFILQELHLYYRMTNALAVNQIQAADKSMLAAAQKSVLGAVLDMPVHVRGTLDDDNYRLLAKLRQDAARLQDRPLLQLLGQFTERLSVESLNGLVNGGDFDNDVIGQIFNADRLTLRAWLNSDDTSNVDRVLAVAIGSPSSRALVVKKLIEIEVKWRAVHPQALIALLDLMNDESADAVLASQASTLLLRAFNTKPRAANLPIFDQKFAAKIGELLATEPVDARTTRARTVGEQIAKAITARADYSGSPCEPFFEPIAP